MSRIPQTFTLEEMQQAFREMYELVRPLEQGKFDLNGRRIRGGDAIDPQEYVTKRQLEQLLTGNYISNRNLISVLRPFREVFISPVEWFLNGGFITRSTAVNALSGTNTTAEMSANGALVEIAWNAAAGNGIAPITTKFRWNRSDKTQFSYKQETSGGSRTEASVFPATVTTQASDAVKVVPYQNFGDGAGSIPAWRGYIHTATISMSSTNNELLIIADVARGANGTDASGLFWAPSNFDPDVAATKDCYLFNFSDSAMTITKFVNGTNYSQAQSENLSDASAATATRFKQRLWIFLDSAGAARVYTSGGQILADIPMTQTDSTVFLPQDGGVVGFRVADQQGVTFSNLVVLEVPGQSRPTPYDPLY